MYMKPNNVVILLMQGSNKAEVVVLVGSLRLRWGGEPAVIVVGNGGSGLSLGELWRKMAKGREEKVPSAVSLSPLFFRRP